MTSTALLSGILYDKTGDGLSPSFANKVGVRYRYYVSMRLLHEGKKDSSGWRLAAKPLEEVVLQQLQQLLGDQQGLNAVLNREDMTIPELEKLTAKAKLLSVDLANDNHTKAYAIIHQVIDRIPIAPGLLTIAVNRKNFAALLVVEITKAEALDDGEVSRVLPLAFLAPDIVEAVFDGRQPLNLTARDLKRLRPLPTSWAKQRQVLGFPAII